MESPPAERHYPKAPIVEALIDIRFSDLLSEDELNKAARRLSKQYPAQEQQNIESINVDPVNKRVTTSNSFLGVRLHSLDYSRICIIRQNTFTVSQLAPYENWDSLVSRAKCDWELFCKSIKRRRVERLAVRYINRIDVPSVEPIVRVEDYLKIYAHLPPDIGDNHRIDQYVMQLVRRVGSDYTVIINTASVDSPVPNCVAFILDFDVFREISGPLKDEKMWSNFSDMRRHKNYLFEGLITDRARALFS